MGGSVKRLGIAVRIVQLEVHPMDEGLQLVLRAKFQRQVMGLFLGDLAVLTIETAGHDDPRPVLSVRVYSLAESASTRLVASRLDQKLSAREIVVAWMPSASPKAAIRNAHFPIIANSMQ